MEAERPGLTTLMGIGLIKGKVPFLIVGTAIIDCFAVRLSGREDTLESAVDPASNKDIVKHGLCPKT